MRRVGRYAVSYTDGFGDVENLRAGSVAMTLTSSQGASAVFWESRRMALCYPVDVMQGGYDPI